MNRHLESTVHDLTSVAITVIEQCSGLITRQQSIDLAITRLESLQDAIALVSESQEIAWAIEISDLIETAVSILVEVIGLSAPSSRNRAGRPKLEISANTIETLLGMKFRVPIIAAMIGVSKETIFRRMREAGLSVTLSGTRYIILNVPTITI